MNDDNKTTHGMKPQFQHDCNNCTFLGTASLDNKKADLYCCIRGDGQEIHYTSLLARYSDDGPDYSSGPANHISIINDFLVIALNRFLKFKGVNGASDCMIGGVFHSEQGVIRLDQSMERKYKIVEASERKWLNKFDKAMNKLKELGITSVD